MNRPDKNSCIETQSGLYLDLLAPDPAVIRIEDIAYGLAGENRYHNQSRPRLNVAEHSVCCWEAAVADHGRGAIARAALLHDAHEAYTKDMARGLKIHDAFFRRVCDGVQRAIEAALQIEMSPAIEREVKRYDNAALAYEARRIMPSQGEGWKFFEEWDIGQELPMRLRFWTPDQAEAQFLKAYDIEQQHRERKAAA